MIFLNEYYEDEDHDSPAKWSKNRAPSHAAGRADGGIHDESYIFQADEHGQLVPVEEENSDHLCSLEEGYPVGQSSNFQKNKVQSKTRVCARNNSRLSNKGSFVQPTRSVIDEQHKQGLFDRKSRSRDACAKQKVHNTQVRPTKVPCKNYVVDVISNEIQTNSEDSIFDRHEGVDVVPQDVDLSEDSDLYAEVQNFIQGHKHAGGLRSKDKTGTVLNNIPTKILMSCVEDENHSRVQPNGGIFRTHTYDRPSSKDTIGGGKPNQHVLSRVGVDSTSRTTGLKPANFKKTLPVEKANTDSRAMSKEILSFSNNHTPTGKLTMVSVLFSITLKGKVREDTVRNNSYSCQHCKRPFESRDKLTKASASKDRLERSTMEASSKLTNLSVKKTMQTPTQTRKVAQMGPKIDRALLNKSILRTETSKENKKTDRRYGYAQQNSKDMLKQTSKPATRLVCQDQRKALLDRDRNVTGLEEISKSPIMRTLNDSKINKEPYERRLSSSKDHNLHQRSKESLIYTPDLTKPQKPVTGAPRSVTPTLQSKKQNMKFR